METCLHFHEGKGERTIKKQKSTCGFVPQINLKSLEWYELVTSA